MAPPPRSIIETRYEQMFPSLDSAEITRLGRFGGPRSYGAGEQLATTGEVGPGMVVIARGQVEIRQHSVLGGDQVIVVHGAGSFLGELAQLSGRPSLVDAVATTDVEALVIPTPRLRDVMVAEAELGERIMRALILRRVGLLESGVGGPVIVGSTGSADVLRLAGFLARSGHPHIELDPEVDPSARALVERFQLGAQALPIVLCASGRMLQVPGRPGRGVAQRRGAAKGEGRREVGIRRSSGARGGRRRGPGGAGVAGPASAAATKARRLAGP